MEYAIFVLYQNVLLLRVLLVSYWSKLAIVVLRLIQCMIQNEEMVQLD